VNNIGSLKAFGISREDWDKNLDYITQNALEDPCTGFNPRKPSLQELKDLCNASYEERFIKINEKAGSWRSEVSSIEGYHKLMTSLFKKMKIRKKLFFIT
jgi:hypothetical protein